MKTVTVATPHNECNMKYSVYGSPSSFVKHCRRHILNCHDCWSQLLDENLFEQGLKYLKKSQQQGSEKTFKSGPISCVYNEVVKKVDEEIQESASQPRYVWYKLTKAGGGERTEELYLSSIGMIMPTTYNVIPTAYIKAKPYDSRKTWALKSWEGVVRKLKRIESSTVDGIHWVNEECWQKAPLPHGELTYFGKLVEKALAEKKKSASQTEEEV